MTPDFDILIAGGGMVGAGLAAALAPTGFRVGVLDAYPFGAPEQPSYDDRSMALAYGSRRILEGVGVWADMREGAAPIRRIHVSERGRFGVTRIDHAEEGVPALGYVLETRLIGRALHRFLQQAPQVELIAPAKVQSITPQARMIRVGLEDGGELSARLLVAADGTHSRLRGLMGVEVEAHDYGQWAVIANVTPERPHRDTAYERFTDQGPIALLPLTGGRCSLVWTHREAELAATEGLDEAGFLAKLQERFGHRLGRFLKVGRRASYPLSLILARRLTSARAVLVGNAAHTLHPVAGQGLNLGLRDVAELAELLAEARAQGGDPGDARLLARYEANRGADLRAVARYTDTLVRLFTAPGRPLAHLRGMGLVALDLIGPLRHLLARHSMGLRASRPRLARGLPLLD